MGQIAVDDLAGDALLWQLGSLGIRTLGLSGAWRRATPDQLPNGLFRLPGRFPDRGASSLMSSRYENSRAGSGITWGLYIRPVNVNPRSAAHPSTAAVPKATSNSGTSGF